MGIEKINALMTASVRLFDTKLGAITTAEIYKTDISEQDDFNDAVEIANIEYNPLDLPSDNTIKEQMIENLIIKIGKVVFSARNADKLSQYLAENISGQEVTYFCSDLRLDTLPTKLKENNISVNEVEAYKTMYSPVKVDDKVNGVLFYSPSTVESYMKENKADKIAFCIGDTTAKEASKYS